MSRKSGIAAVVAVLMVVVALIAPYLIGLKVESRFRDMVTVPLRQSDVSIEVTDYQRGWFGAKATTVVRRGDVRVVFKHDIHHGPWFNFALASIRSVPKIEDGTTSVQWNFDGTPLTIDTRIAFSGGYTAQLRSAKATARIADDGNGIGRLEWGGLTGQFNESDGRVALTFNAPKIAYSNDDTQIVFDNMHVESDGSTYENLDVEDKPVDWPGRFMVAVDSASIRNKAMDTDEPPGLVTGLEFETRLQQPDSETLDYTVRLAVSDLSLRPPPHAHQEPMRTDSGEISLGLTGLRANAMKKLLLQLRQVKEQVSLDTEAGRQRARRLTTMHLMTQLPALLAGNPKFTVEIPPLSTDHGVMQAEIEAALTPLSPEMKKANAPPLAQMMSRLTIDAQGLVEKTLMGWLRGDAGPAAERRQRVAIQELAKRGLITLKDDRVATEVHYDADKLVINGEEVPPGFLLMLARGLSQ